MENVFDLDFSTDGNGLDSLGGTKASSSKLKLPEIDAVLEDLKSKEKTSKDSNCDLVKFIEDNTVNIDDEYEKAECFLRVGGVDCFARRDIVAIKAKAKAGKSTLIGLQISSLVSGKWNDIERIVEHIPRIVYFDTEMNEYDTHKLLYKIHKMANIPLDRRIENLRFVNLRRLTVDDCRNKIFDSISYLRPDIVFIDGLVDMISDFNNVEESINLVRELIKCADENNCCIVAVLHTNKQSYDNNMRGHLGTMLTQKSSLVLECKKDGNIVNVICCESRHEPFSEWAFMYDNDGIPVSANDILKKQQEDKQREKEENQTDCLMEKLETVCSLFVDPKEWTLRSAIVNKFMSSQSISNSKAQVILKKLIEMQNLEVKIEGGKQFIRVRE